MMVTLKVQKGRLLKWQEGRSFVCGKQTFVQGIFIDLPCVHGPGQSSEEDNSEHGRQAQSQMDIGVCDIPHPHFTDEETMVQL